MIYEEDMKQVRDEWNMLQKDPRQQSLKSIHRITCKDGSIKWIYLQIICENSEELLLCLYCK